MTAIIDAIEAGKLDATVAVVFSNNPDAQGLEIAKSRGIPTASLSQRGMKRQQHEQQVLDLLANYEFDYVVLAGYMRVLSE
ncbi:phosphoribosylglycinamide formyltransferase, partial [Glaesserella parasuis]|uniref:phosphoribosylglycinamide formyltransferase n=1 Tax=Glaesserella parasuis TaxID=738 RepID=UPI003F2C49FD